MMFKTLLIKIGNRLKSTAGDTLIEVLGAILVIALASGLLVLGSGTAAKLNRTGEQLSERRTNQMNAAEMRNAQPEESAVTVTVTFEEDATNPVSVSAQLYGEEGGAFFTYRKARP